MNRQNAILNLVVTVAMLMVLAASALYPTPASAIQPPGAATAAIEPAQQGPDPLRPVVQQPVKNDVSPALRDMNPHQLLSQPEGEIPLLRLPKAQSAPTLLGQGVDPVLQSQPGLANMPAPLANFDGVDNQTTLTPPDTQGDIGYDPATGKKYYLQWVNIWFAVWDVTDLANPTKVYPATGFADGNSLWSGFGGAAACQSTNDGDPITLFDPIANRWFMSQFALPNYPSGPFYVCIAVSQSADPTGAWYRYAYEWTDGNGNDVMNDYPKFGVWPDGYYMTVNQFYGSDSYCQGAWCGGGVAAFERAKMLNGQSAQMVKFDLLHANVNFGGMLPSDLDGPTLPPAGAPNYFAEVDDSSYIGPTDAMRLWEFKVNWTTPASSTFGINGQPNLTLPVASFTPICSTCIPQPDTSVQLDTLGDRLMHRMAYRNFGDHESMVVNHTVDAGSGRAGVRWYEVRRTGGAWSIYQQGTFAPSDGLYRWMGSLAMDHMGNTALGYSVASSSLYPSVRYAGRLADDPLDQMPQAEVTLVTGSGSQTSSYHRWGDYSMMGLDPEDDCTFWYTQEYYPATSSAHWYTRIGAFKFPNCVLETRGTLVGRVSDAATGLGLASVTIQAVPGSGEPATWSSKDDGIYLAKLVSDTYTVTASTYGYLPQTATGITVSVGMTSTKNFSLTATSYHVVSGTVRDAVTGWPLYSHITLAGEPHNPPTPLTSFWTDPVSGFYSVTLAEGITYTLSAAAWAPGYLPASQAIGPLTADATLNFDLAVNPATCNAPGYSPGCVPSAGGLVVGNVYDANTSTPLAGASVANSRGDVATAQTTQDPAVADSFYTLFAPAGVQPLTATMAGGYAPVVQTPTVVQSNTIRQDFTLPAGKLAYTPAGLEAALQMGQSAVLPLTLTNGGGLAADFSLSEIDQGYGPLAPTFVNVPGSHRALGSSGRAGVGAPFRYPGGYTYYDPNPLMPTPANVLLLFADQGDGEPLRSTLSSYSDIGTVATHNAFSITPTLADLRPYDVVIVWNDFAFADPVAVGNALADYVDGSGRVVVAAFAWYATGDLGGRFANGSYSPFISEGLGNHPDGASLGAYDVGHPIMQGVAAVTERYRNYVALSPGAELVARWNDGEEFIAAKGRVVAINSYPGYYYQWIGDAGIILHNAVKYLMAPTDVPWLSETPISGTLATSTQQLVNVGLNAEALRTADPGQYRAQLRIQHNTPYPLANVPVTLTLSAPSSWGKLNGTVAGLGACDAPGAALSNATVVITNNAGTAWTQTTDSGGNYQLWMAASESPLTLTVSFTGYVPLTMAGIVITLQMTTTQPVALRLAAPCLAYNPSAFDITLVKGQSITLALTITNSGPLPLNWALTKDAPWLTTTPTAATGLTGAQIVGVRFDATALDAGTYTTPMSLTHNAPGSTVVLPTTLNVIVYKVYLPIVSKQ